MICTPIAHENQLQKSKNSQKCICYNQHKARLLFINETCKQNNYTEPATWLIKVNSSSISLLEILLR